MNRLTVIINFLFFAYFSTPAQTDAVIPQQGNETASPGNLDASLTLLKQQLDNVSLVHKKLNPDSLPAWKKNDDWLTVTIAALHKARRLIEENDPIVKTAAQQLTMLRSAPSTASPESMEEYKDRNGDIKRLDSLSFALQNKKSTLTRFEEIIKVDSVIDTETTQLYEVNKSGATAEQISEKQQLLENSKAKRSELLHDQTMAAMAARYSKSDRNDVRQKTATQISAIQYSLDSIAKAREKIVREIVLFEKDFLEKSGLFAKRCDTLSVALNKVSLELNDLKTRIQALERDSVEACNQRAAASAAAAAEASKQKKKGGSKR